MKDLKSSIINRKSVILASYSNLVYTSCSYSSKGDYVPYPKKVGVLFSGENQKGGFVALLKWGGKLSPQCYIVAENAEEESFIRSYPEDIERHFVDGKMAFILSATLPLDYLFDLRKKVTFASIRTQSFPGRTIVRQEERN